MDRGRFLVITWVTLERNASSLCAVVTSLPCIWLCKLCSFFITISFAYKETHIISRRCWPLRLWTEVKCHDTFSMAAARCSRTVSGHVWCSGAHLAGHCAGQSHQPVVSGQAQGLCQVSGGTFLLNEVVLRRHFSVLCLVNLSARLGLKMPFA